MKERASKNPSYPSDNVRKSGQSRLPSRPSGESGQAITEYAILGAIIGIAGIITIWLFGTAIMAIFTQLARAMNDETDIDLSVVQQVGLAIDQDAEVIRHMGNFDQQVEGGIPLPPLPPPAPPTTSDPLAYVATHHLGDNWAAGSTGGTPLQNEGLSYDITFTLTQDMLDYANYASDGMLYLTFDAGDHGQSYHAFINDEHVNAVQINGQTIGYAANGHNVMAFDISGIEVGNQTLTFTSGLLSGIEYDDYDFFNLGISYEAPTL